MTKGHLLLLDTISLATQINFVFPSQLRAGGIRTNSKNHVKKLHSILSYAEISRGFAEVKQALVASKFAGVQWGSMIGTLLF